MTRRGTRSSVGTTLVELAVATSIAITALLVLYEITASVTRTQAYVAARDSAQARANKLVTDVRAAAFASRRVLQDDAEGRSYFGALETGEFPPAAGTHLPVIDTAGRLEADAAGTRFTGNAMMLVCESPPMDVRTTQAHTRRVDLVRFFAVYPTLRARRVCRSIPQQTDLVGLASVTYADKSSLDAITDATDKKDAVVALRNAGVTRAWAVGAPLASSFFDLLANGTVATTPDPLPRIEPPPGYAYRNLLGDSKMTVAANDPKLQVPAFAEATAAAPAYPGGFEIKVVGPFGGRQVLVRLVVVAGVAGSEDAVAKTSRIFSVRDL